MNMREKRAAMQSMISDWRSSEKARRLTARKMGSTKRPFIIGFRAVKKMTQQASETL